MLSYYRFMADLPHPSPAKTVYHSKSEGHGWPEHCPPVRSASAYGWDVINPFDMHFIRDSSDLWTIKEAIEVESDVDLADGTTPHPQLNAWFWEKDQKRPHIITSNVYDKINHQVKISTYLYLQTDDDWMISIRSIPGDQRAWTTIEAIVEADWYWPAHPLHGVIELPLDKSVKEVIIKKGEPLFRLLPVLRSEFVADEMSDEQFANYFAQGQKWLAKNGKKVEGDDMLLTGVYAKQQDAAKFKVNPQ
jgi:hypothetical protein